MKYGLCSIASAGLMLLAAPAFAAAQSGQLSQQDKTFIMKAEDGNLAEATLGRMAEQKAQSPEVKEYGRWMATDHSFAQKQLLRLAQRAGDTHQPKLTQKDKTLQQKLESARPGAFDEDYVHAMVQDHKTDIDAFKTEAQGGHNAEIKSFARNLTPVLEQHLAEAEQLAAHAPPVAGAARNEASGSSVPPKR